MPYNVPNTPDVPHVNLAEPDAGDYLALAFNRTGVISGGTVVQSGSPNMTVQVGAAEIVIDGAPIAKAAGPVTLDASTANPRFDIIGWYVSGSPVAIKGSPSNNPSYPVFDPMTFCMTAVVYVSAGTVSITTPFIIQKQVTPTFSLRRHYVAENDIMLEATTPLKSNSFRLLANGVMSWVSSTLSSTADAAMEWLTSLTIRQLSATDKALILKVFGPGVKGNNVLEIQPSSATSPIAGMDAVGRIFGTNFRLGTGSPEGIVIADKGTLYLNEDPASGNAALWVKLTNGVNTGWSALASYVPASQAIPVGGVVMWPGVIGTDPVPVGYLWCNGAEYAVATYPDLGAFCAEKFGTAGAGNFKVPDYRGRTPFGVDGTLATVPGTNLGASSVTLSIEQMPAHQHEITDEAHAHPAGGRYVYQVEQAYLPSYQLPLNTGSGLGMDLEPIDFEHTTMTTMSALSEGGGQPISILQPSQSTNFIIKT